MSQFVAMIGYPYPEECKSNLDLMRRWGGAYCQDLENYVQSLRNLGATDEILRGRIIRIHSSNAHDDRYWSKITDRLYDAETLEFKGTDDSVRYG